nr:adenylate/guanylate cyclase domain-containing protein [Ardenticatenales bacterium]
MWNPLLAAYLPMDRLQALATGRALREHSSGATLLADLSGFTPLAEELARVLGPRRGAEEVARQINAVYDALLPQIRAYGGSVIDFAGDAMVGYFDEDDGLRATACALAMQAAMGSFQALPLPTGAELALGLKVGIARGSVRRFLVGNPSIQCLEAMGGAPIVRMSAAEQQARRGEVLLDSDCALPLAHALQVAEWRDAKGGRYARV